VKALRQRLLFFGPLLKGLWVGSVNPGLLGVPSAQGGRGFSFGKTARAFEADVKRAFRLSPGFCLEAWGGMIDDRITSVLFAGQDKMSNVTRFPSNGWRRASNRRGKRSVSCIVSDRFLRFEEKMQMTEEGTAVIMHVMTDGSGEERKLTTLIITLEQLRGVLRHYG
jgi:hypothetical protein